MLLAFLIYFLFCCLFSFSVIRILLIYNTIGYLYTLVFNLKFVQLNLGYRCLQAFSVQCLYTVYYLEIRSNARGTRISFLLAGIFTDKIG